MANATWIITDSRTGITLWSKLGAAPPDVVVDEAIYRDVFKLSFPDANVVWGAGRFSVKVVSEDGGVYRVGSMVRFKIDNLVGVPDESDIEDQSGMVRMANSGAPGAQKLVEDVPLPIGARTIQSDDLQREANQLLGKSGIPGMKVQEGIPQPMMPEPLAALKILPSTPPEVRMPAPLPPGVELNVVTKPAGDTPEFLVMLRNFKAKLLKADSVWGLRLEALPDFVKKHVAADPEGALVNEDTPWRGVFVKGTSETATSLDYEPFLLDDRDVKTRTYVNWVKGFMYIEHALSGDTEPSYEHLFRIALEMFEDATVLYLMENGWDPHKADGQPWGTVLVDVVREMEARVQFLKGKDLEYGQPTRRQGVPGVITRLWDKIARYTNLKANPDLLPKFESMADSAKDLGGYSAILAGQLQECLEEQNPSSPWCNTNLMEHEA